jgi:hypothetical protein
VNTGTTIRLGCTLLANEQALAYRAWGCDMGIQTTCMGAQFRCEPCWADQCLTVYSDPISDNACWADPTNPVSGRFWGVYITKIEGLDTPVSTRAVYPTIGGGAAIGPEVLGARGLQITGVLLAADCAAMEYGKRWFQRLLTQACRWGTAPQHVATDNPPKTLCTTCGTTVCPQCVTAGITSCSTCSASKGGCGCNTGSIMLRTHCPQLGDNPNDGLVTLHNVAATGGVTWSAPGPCCCEVQAFTIDLVAGRPEMWAVQAKPGATFTITDMEPICPDCDPDGMSGGGELSNCSDCGTCNKCVAVADCLVDPLCTTTAITAPPTYVTAGVLDEQGRPSCGTGSANYGSAIEVLWSDLAGRPAYGPGSAHYLEGMPESPVYDSNDIPSCGGASAQYGSQPATPAAVDTIVSNTAGDWTTKTVVRSGLMPCQAAALFVVITPAGGAQIRKVTRSWVESNPNAAPSSVSYEPISVAPNVTASAVTASGVPLVAVGSTVAVTFSWDEKIVAGSTVTVNVEQPACAAITGPNAGFDRACAGCTAGPNSADRAQVLACVSTANVVPKSFVGGWPAGIVGVS